MAHDIALRDNGAASFDMSLAGGAAYAIVGAVNVTATPSATTDFTRHAALVGAVTVTAIPAATMEYTPGSAGYEIVGDVLVLIEPAASLDFTPHTRLLC